MVLHEEYQIVDFAAGKPHALPQAGDDLRADAGVAVPLSFPDVVAENREDQEVLPRYRPVDGEKRLLVVGAVPFPFEAGKDARGENQVDIDGVDVVDVALHAEGQGSEFRDVSPQEPALVHRKQGFVQEVGVRQDRKEQLRRVRILGILGSQCRQGALDALLGLRRGDRPGLLHGPEELEDTQGLFPERDTGQGTQLPPVEHAHPVDIPLPEGVQGLPVPLDEIPVDLLQELFGQVRGDGSVHVVGPHEPLHCKVPPAVPVSENAGYLVLDLESQDVGLLPRQGVKLAAYPEEIVPGVPDRPDGLFPDHALVAQFEQVPALVLDPGRPHGGVKVPQSCLSPPSRWARARRPSLRISRAGSAFRRASSR